ncbi:MAG TPA: DUF6455 family protein [Marinobacter sp.]|nr:DUF6455 family protein [Marinobacter sp.]
MNKNIRAAAPAPKPGFMHRLKDNWLAGQYRGAVRAMHMEAPASLAEIMADASPALEPVVAAEIESLLRTGGAPFVRLSKTLMPRMRANFGVTEAQLGALAAGHLAAVEDRCNSCREAARCWTALRARETAEQCRTFCPNAEVFEELAGQNQQPGL